MPEKWKNKLYFGDNLPILRKHIPDESVDFIYLDPPFNSKVNYNILFKEKSGENSTAQISAFDDTWHWGAESEEIYYELITSGPRKVADLMQAFRVFLGQNDMMAYLIMMTIRLLELHRVLKPTGNLYLHCDPVASHYLKIILDSIFSPRMFVNEIVWKRAHTVKGNVGQGSKMWGPNTDSLMFYRKTEKNTFHQVFLPYSDNYIKTFFKYVESDGRRYRLISMIGPGGAAKGNPQYEVMGVTRYWRYSKVKMQTLISKGLVVQTKPGTVPLRKQYLDEGKGVSVQSLWDDILPLGASDRERLGYPTQKPESLLERIIKSSSNKNDIILDPFCGCGTTISVAERLNRRWIGIDITHLAISLMGHRIQNTFKDELSPYKIFGVPTDIEGAKSLAQENRYQFEWWAVGLIDAFPFQDKKKGADTGIDGYINFFDDKSGKAKKIMVQVKSGKVSSPQVRDLKGVIERENAVIGVFITLNEPTKPMKKEAISAGFYEPEYLPGKKYSRIQILTIKELLKGKNVEYPRILETTFKKAQRKTKKKLYKTQRNIYDQE